MLGSKQRPVRWSERRQRLDELGPTWPVPFPYTTLFRSGIHPPEAERQGTRGDVPGDHHLVERPEDRRDQPGRGARAEEHTTEHQSQFYLVCRLLLEKKNKMMICSPGE